MGRMKKVISLTLTACLIISGILTDSANSQAANVRLNKKTASLRVGKTTQLRVYGTKKKITWRSSKKSIAEVSPTGKVTAKKLGTARIYAKYSGRKLTCKVTVTGSAADSKSGGRLRFLLIKRTRSIITTTEKKSARLRSS